MVLPLQGCKSPGNYQPLLNTNEKQMVIDSLKTSFGKMELTGNGPGIRQRRDKIKTERAVPDDTRRAETEGRGRIIMAAKKAKASKAAKRGSYYKVEGAQVTND